MRRKEEGNEGKWKCSEKNIKRNCPSLSLFALSPMNMYFLKTRIAWLVLRYSHKKKKKKVSVVNSLLQSKYLGSTRALDRGCYPWANWFLPIVTTKWWQHVMWNKLHRVAIMLWCCTSQMSKSTENTFKRSNAAWIQDQIYRQCNTTILRLDFMDWRLSLVWVSLINGVSDHDLVSKSSCSRW